MELKQIPEFVSGQTFKEIDKLWRTSWSCAGLQQISDVRLYAPIDTMLPRGLLNMEECTNQQLDFNEMACDEVAFTAYRPDNLINTLNLSSKTITAA